MKTLTYKLFLPVLLLYNVASFAQKPIELSLGTIKTALKDGAIDIGIKYLRSLDSTFKEQDILLAQHNSLFQATPEINIQTGTADAFSAINVKMQGLWMFFPTTTVAGQVTPNTAGLMHCIPVSVGLETNNKFNILNGIIEAGYVPWYQSAMMSSVPAWIKHTKVGVFLQSGYKFALDKTGNDAIGGQTDESGEKPDNAIFRAKGSFAIDTKSLFELYGIGVGLVGSTDGWYDFLNKQVYYTIEGKFRLYLTSAKEQYLDFKYQKGSGAPNFNEGDQFGLGLTVRF